MVGVVGRVLGGIDTQRRNGFESVIREKFVLYFEDLVEVRAVVIRSIERFSEERIGEEFGFVHLVQVFASGIFHISLIERGELQLHVAYVLARQHVRNMQLQLTALYKADVEYSRGKDLDEMYEAELFAYPLLTETFDGADYYGSDFDKILEIEYELLSDNGLEPVASLRIYPSENTSYDPDHLKIDNLDLFQDDDDWTEYWTRVPALHNIRFCHSLHHMSDHQNLPLVDILHKTSFSIDIKHTLTIDNDK